MILNVITLPQRKEQIKSEVDRLGITAVYWDAIVQSNTVQAVSQSHKMIVQFALQNNLPEIAIAEDDCIFSSINSYKYFLDNKPDDFDIYLGGYYSGIKRPDNTMYSFCGLHLYIIHSRYYRQFLSTSPMKNIDNAQAGFGKFVVCEPLVARQRNGYSFHRKREVNDDSRLVDKNFLED